ncbi:MAG TPA: HAD-IA family hydrolase [Solirubrobacteraceae bacterium]
MKAVLLDALGTLVRLEPPAPRLRAHLAPLGIEVTEEQAAAAIAAEIRYYRSHLELGRDARTLAQLRRDCAEALAAALPATPATQALDLDALTAALLASLEFTAFDDVRPALTAWRERGLRLVVVSNWDVSLHEVLGRLGITSLLDGILTSAEAGVSKPSAAIFERALRLAGSGPSEAVHVGDSFAEDVVGARAAGIEPVLIVRGAAAAPTGVRTITSLRELDPAAHSEP